MRAGHGQALLDHALPDHVAGRLVLEAVHALVEVVVTALLHPGRLAFAARYT